MNYSIYVVVDRLEKFYREAIEEYEKRLSRYCKSNLVCVKNVEVLEKKLDKRAHLVEISTAGEGISSTKLSEKINSWGVFGKSNVIFIIGGEDIHSHEKISLGKMTMAKGLSAVVLYEQIYRGYRILNNEPYHK